MLRTTILALATATTLGAAALSPNAASAHGWHEGWHGGWHGGEHGRIFRPGYGVYAGYGGCWVRRWVYTPYGSAFRLVNRCY